MGAERKKINIGLWILVAYSISTIFSDISSVANEKIILFYFSKILLLISFLLLVLKNYTSSIDEKTIKKMFLILIMAYCLSGEYFCPGYHLGFLQAVLSAAFIYDVSRRFNLMYIVSFGVLYLILFSFLNEQHLVTSYYPSYFLDIKIATVSVTVLSFFTYNEISKVKIEKELISKKFIDIGKNYAEIVHELKGVAFTPSIYINILEKKLNENNFNEAKNIVKTLKEEYNSITDYILKINSLSKTSDEITLINVQESLEFICKSLFKNKMKNKELEFQIDGEVSFNEHDFKSIMINLLNNSLDNFEIKKTNNPKIKITVENQKVIFEDNGGGFSELALRKIKSSSYFTEKTHGSGLGLFLIKNYLEGNGKAKFFNNKNGAVVELTFNKNKTVGKQV